MSVVLLAMAVGWGQKPGGSPVVAQVANGEVQVRILRTSTEFVEELSARDAKGVYRPILASPTAPSIKPIGPYPTSSLLKGSHSNLFTAPPTFHFSEATTSGRNIVLKSKIGDWAITKTIEVPASGSLIGVRLDADTAAALPQMRFLLNCYAFVPGKPDETWTPGLRPHDDEVIGDHWFRSPAAILRKGGLSATVMPDIDVLRDNRPIPTILDLDVNNGVVRSPLVSYGFSDHKLVGHVRFASDDSMTEPVPWKLKLRSEIDLRADAAPGSAVSTAAKYMWKRYGHSYFDKVLPQVMPFADYAELCYPAAFKEKQTDGWFEQTIDGQVCGGLPSGWGLDRGWVSWQCWFMQLRSAWGLHWWGKKLNHPDWVDKSNKMLNLALAAPRKDGLCATTYDSRKKEWLGGLINPSEACYYDVPSIAWKSIWLLRWLELPDCPRRDEVEKQVQETYEEMLKLQRPDGSFPSWLSKDMKVVSPLDRSAQSALPAWFIGEYARYKAKPLQDRIADLNAQLGKTGRDGGSASMKDLHRQLDGLQAEVASFGKITDRLQLSANFLRTQVVPKALYYDFETFFSCSPKVCLQQNNVLDDPKMWDPHTQQPPQNTLSMQWAAEALRATNELTGRIYSLTLPHVERPGRPTDPGNLSSAIIALDTMNLYQNVWPVSYRPVAYTYGGFGVQNSDGEFDDARQAQFGASLCDFGADLNRPDLFERGVAAIRASLALVNIPNDPYHIYPNPNYPVGLEPENCGHGGGNEQDGRSGFDWAEGSGLAAAAEVMNRYGSTYKGRGWSVLIDGTPAAPAKPVVLQDPTFDFAAPSLKGWEVDATFLNWPTRSNRRDFGAMGKPFIGTCEDGKGWFDDSFVGTLTSPRFMTSKDRIRLLVGGGSVRGVGVELIDEDGKQLAVVRGSDDEKMHEVELTTSQYRGKTLRIRIFDQEKGPWGHINVGWIRA